jgi:hypothetical protein
MARSKRTIISRRAVLRGIVAGGIAVAVPLPRLIGMLNDDGTAYAAGAPLPVRFGTWFFGNGIIPSRWVPPKTGVGANWELSEELSPLQAVKPYISVITGLTIKGPDISPHKAMPVQALTAAQTGNGTVQLPTIDQVAAGITNTSTLYPKGIHVGMSGSGGTMNISWSGPNAPNAPNMSPANLFQLLLKYASTGTGMPMAPDPSLLRRRAVLDAIADESKALRARLGVEDQQRLDQHLSGLNQLQNQLIAAGMPHMTGTITDPDKAYPNRGADGDNITRMRGQAFSDLLAFALAGDLTRVFSYQFSSPSCQSQYTDAGLSGAFHEDYGHRTSPKGVQFATEGFNSGIKFTMSCLSDTLARLRNTPDGAGNLLDNSVLYTTSCVSESQTHGGTDYPILVSGKAGGKLKGDTHVRLVGENVSRVGLTLLTALGSNATSWGTADSMATTGIPELLA